MPVSAVLPLLVINKYRLGYSLVLGGEKLSLMANEPMVVGYKNTPH